MGTVLRMTAATERFRQPRPDRFRRARRRWRFQLRGLLGLLLVTIFAINLYVLADGVVRLIKSRRNETILRQQQSRQLKLNSSLQQNRDWMASDDYLREQARNLGYASPDEPTISTSGPPPVESPVKRRRDRPCPPY